MKYGPCIRRIEFNDDYSYTYNGVLFTGIAYEIDAASHLIGEITFVNGVQEGLTRTWFPSGARQAERNLRRNAFHGPGLEWYESGKIKERTLHESGITLERDVWDEGGTLISSYRLREDQPNYQLLLLSRKAEQRREND